jgi:hypothetical protein
MTIRRVLGLCDSNAAHLNRTFDFCQSVSGETIWTRSPRLKLCQALEPFKDTSTDVRPTSQPVNPVQINTTRVLDLNKQFRRGIMSLFCTTNVRTAKLERSSLPLFELHISMTQSSKSMPSRAARSLISRSLTGIRCECVLEPEMILRQFF